MKTAVVGFPVEVETNNIAAPPDLSALPSARPYRLQRALDWAVLIACSPVLLPAGLLIGLCVGLTSRGPVLFKQERVGLHGNNFQDVYKRQARSDGGETLPVASSVPVGASLGEPDVVDGPPVRKVVL